MLPHAMILLMLIGAPSDDDDADKKAEAGKHLAAGNALLESGDAAGALDAYRQAYDAFPSPKIFFNMAEAQRELQNFIEAAELYQRVVNEVSPDSPLVKLAQDRLSEIEGRIAHVSVTTDPSGAVIEIGGKEAGTSPLYNVAVAPGTIEIRATYQGRSETRSVDVAAGDSQNVSIELVDVSSPPPPPPPPSSDGDDSIVGKWWFWTVIGVGVVAAGTTVAVVATSGDDFVPMGELGTSRLDEWRRR